MTLRNGKLLFCILHKDGTLADGANGLAIGNDEQEAWDRALNPSEGWAIEKAKSAMGLRIGRCVVTMVKPE